MAKQVIVLDTSAADGGFITVRTVMWFIVGSPIPQSSNLTSNYSGATQGELDELRAGRTREEVRTYQFAVGTTAASIKATLLAAYNARVAWLGTQPAAGQFYGVFLDSISGWSA